MYYFSRASDVISIPSRFLLYSAVAICGETEMCVMNIITSFTFTYFTHVNSQRPVTVAERSKACTDFGRSEAGIVGSNPTQGIDVWCLCVCVRFSVFVYR
jgi:hypothetical protein